LPTVAAGSFINRQPTSKIGSESPHPHHRLKRYSWLHFSRDTTGKFFDIHIGRTPIVATKQTPTKNQ
ncbi:MAG: hypothetical protein MKZ95_15780, partial [Pirellulales bacterium]|nr:hypothetical protein [Pirellulales bacterium]